MLFIHAKHSPSYISVHALSYSVIIINQSIHINLSAGAQNITGTYVIIMLVCGHLLTTCLPWKSSVQIMLEKQQKLFVRGYNLEVHDVIKYTQKHCTTVIISRAGWFYLCDITSRSHNRLSSSSKVRITPC